MFWFLVWVEKDAYVLCRVFHKNNIGPPNSHRYAPFIEEEWDDGTLALVPGKEARDKTVSGHGVHAEDSDQDAHVEEADHDARAEEAGRGVLVEGNGHCTYVENNFVECVENRQDSFVDGNHFEQVCASSEFVSFVYLVIPLLSW